MTVFEFINQHFEDFDKLYKAGLLKYKAIHYFSIYSRYLYYTKQGNSKTKSITMAAHDNYVCKSLGFYAIKQMEKEL